MSREDILAANNLTEDGLRAVGAQLALKGRGRSAYSSRLSTIPPKMSCSGGTTRFWRARRTCAAPTFSWRARKKLRPLSIVLVAGEDFGTLAMELSTGPSGPSGGDLGCGVPSQFVAEFSLATLQAEVGVPHGPIRSSFGWHVILVSERTAPIFEDLRDDTCRHLGRRARRGIVDELAGRNPRSR